MDNIQSNKTVLPLIVDAVMLCAKQQIALRGHRDYNIDFADAEYQGCCLHSLNLVICHACQIKSIQNMMDCCRELYSFFDNSPKRQCFMEIVIDAHSPDNKKQKLKNLDDEMGRTTCNVRNDL